VNENLIYERIKQALAEAPRNQYTAELHLQMIKYADELKSISEFSKMRNLVKRLKAAGMDTKRL